jgi:hypothetical protein
MNRKQFIILIVLLLVIGGAGLAIYRKQSGSWQSTGAGMGRKFLADLPVNDVEGITIRQNDQQATLVKSNETWIVQERNGYPANFTELSALVRRLVELKVVQPVEVGPSQRPRLELVEPGKGTTNSGTLVEFKGSGDKVLRKILLGKKHVKKSAQPSPFGDEGGFPDGRYILAKDNEVVLVNDPLTSVEPKPEQWLNKDWFKVEKVRSVSLVSTNATNSWKLTRDSESAEWKLEEPKAGEQLETTKVSGLATALMSPSFNDVVVGKKNEELGLDRPVRVLMETFDGFKYDMAIGNKAGEDDVYFTIKVEGNLARERSPGKDEKPEDKEKLDKEHKETLSKLEEKLKREKSYEKWVYTMPKWTVDNLVKDRSQLMVEKKEEPKPEDANPANPSSAPPALQNPPSLPTPPES